MLLPPDMLGMTVLFSLVEPLKPVLSHAVTSEVLQGHARIQEQRYFLVGLGDTDQKSDLSFFRLNDDT